MGASALKTYNYVVNSTENSGSYYMNLKTSSIKKFTKCYTSNSSYLTCKLSNDGKGVSLKAKKSGTVTVHVYGINNKGKTVSLSRKLKYVKILLLQLVKFKLQLLLLDLRLMLQLRLHVVKMLH